MSRARLLFPLALAILALPIPASGVQPGYIDRQSFDVTNVLSAAPMEGSDRYDQDRRIFRSTRSFQNTPRWVLAVNDVQTDIAHLMADFSCAAGITMNRGQAPRLALLMEKASADTRAETAMAKRHFKRLRPFLIDQGPICEPASDVQDTYDYPSGHTTLGWTWATILAQLLPERGAQILARGRAYGESRIVCGVHNASAVEAGRTSASATLAVMRASAAYQRDFQAVRRELKRLQHRPTKPDAEQCRAEEALVAEDIFAPPGVHVP